MLGFGTRMEPVFMNTVATSCAGMSVYIERMTARSSAWAAVLAKTSLTSKPLWPYFEKLNGEPSAISLPPIVFPFIRVRAGFGSHVSMWDGAPEAKIWMTDLALPGKWEGRGVSGPIVVLGPGWAAIRSAGSSIVASDK